MKLYPILLHAFVFSRFLTIADPGEGEGEGVIGCRGLELPYVLGTKNLSN